MLIFYLSIMEDSDDKNAFEQLYINYRKQMYYLAKSLLGEDTAAEDIVHDVFVSVATKHMATVRKIENEKDLRNYLLKATKNTCLNYIQKQNRTRVSLDTVSETNLLNKGKNMTDEEFWEYIHNVNEARRVLDAIIALPAIYRDALYYHFVMELTARETAKIVGEKLSTVKKRLVRGKTALIESLNAMEEKEFSYDNSRV